VTDVCKQCTFFYGAKEKLNSNTTTGECRARPPIMTDAENFGVWPLVTGEGWCGEFHGDRAQA